MSSLTRNTLITVIAILVCLNALQVFAGPISFYREPTAGELLRDAAFDGNTEAVSRLLARGADVNWAHPLGEGWTALYWAIHENRYDTAKLLIEKGAAVNVRDKRGCTPLYWASLSGNARMIGLLMKHGARRDIADRSRGWDPLMRASYMGHTDAVALLADGDTDLNRKDRWGNTALTLAARAKKRDTVGMLLSKGATPDATARRVMATLDESFTVRSMERMQVIKYEAGRGGDRTHKVRAGRSAKWVETESNGDMGAGRMTRTDFSMGGLSRQAKAERLIQRAVVIWDQIQREFPEMADQLLQSAQRRQAGN